MKKNSIFYINHAVSKPAVKMSLDELQKLQESSYALERNSTDYSPTEISRPVGIKEFTFIETEKNILGVGQYCTVYKGTAAKSLPELANKSEAFSIVKVAVKIGNGGLLSNIKIKLEAQILSHLNHNHIIQFIHESEQQKIPILVLEYLPLGNLYEYVKNKKNITKELWLDWSKQITDAINYVHHYGIIHNDVKPHNIMMSSGLQLKLCDFGNSCFVPEANQTLFDNAQDIEKYDQSTCFKVVPPLIYINPGNPRYKDSQILHNGAARGTLAYTAPELIQNQSYSFQADIYSFGILLYFLLSGLDPFARSKSNIYMIIGIKRGFFESGLQEYWNEKFLSGEEVCSEIIHLIHIMLDLDPLNRPLTKEITDILNALK